MNIEYNNKDTEVIINGIPYMPKSEHEELKNKYDNRIFEDKICGIPINELILIKHLYNKEHVILKNVAEAFARGVRLAHEERDKQLEEQLKGMENSLMVHFWERAGERKPMKLEDIKR